MVFLFSALAIARPSSAQVFTAATSTTTTVTTTIGTDVCTFATSSTEFDIACTIQEGTSFTLPVNLPDNFYGSFPIIDLCESTSPCPLEYTDASQISDVLATVQTGPSMQLTFYSDTDSESGSTWVPEDSGLPGATFPIADINALDLVALPEGTSGMATTAPTCQTDPTSGVIFCLTLTLVSDPVEQPPTGVPEFPIAASMFALVAVALVALNYLRRQSLMNLNQTR